MAASLVLDASGAGGGSVPAGPEPDHLESAGEAFGQLDGALITLAAGAQEHGLVKSRRKDTCQGFGQLNHGWGNHAGEEMIKLCCMGLDGLHDLRMAVAEQTGHLTRRPIHDLLPRRGL